jgi:hypothetical protein
MLLRSENELHGKRQLGRRRRSRGKRQRGLRKRRNDDDRLRGRERLLGRRRLLELIRVVCRIAVEQLPPFVARGHHGRPPALVRAAVHLAAEPMALLPVVDEDRGQAQAPEASHDVRLEDIDAVVVVDGELDPAAGIVLAYHRYHAVHSRFERLGDVPPRLGDPIGPRAVDVGVVALPDGLALESRLDDGVVEGAGDAVVDTQRVARLNQRGTGVGHPEPRPPWLGHEDAVVAKRQRIHHVRQHGVVIRDLGRIKEHRHGHDVPSLRAPPPSKDGASPRALPRGAGGCSAPSATT